MKKYYQIGKKRTNVKIKGGKIRKNEVSNPVGKKKGGESTLFWTTALW